MLVIVTMVVVTLVTSSFMSYGDDECILVVKIVFVVFRISIDL